MALIDRLLPPRCLLCGDPGMDGMAICLACHQDLPGNARPCVRCAQPLPAESLQVCGQCLWHPPPYTAIHVPFRYEVPIDWLVHRLKFAADLAAGRLLGQLLARAVSGHLGPVRAVLPLPLHTRRLAQRGFNQSREIALPLARALGAPIQAGLLRRRGGLTAQMELPARQRRANVRGAFRAGRPAPPGRLLLVDDVVTTASTIREASHSLDAGERTEIVVCAVARA